MGRAESRQPTAYDSPSPSPLVLECPAVTGARLAQSAVVFTFGSTRRTRSVALSVGGNQRLFLGVDTGGTFTDLVLMDGRGTIATAKASTTPEALETGVLAAIEEVAVARRESVGELLAQVRSFGHGTTQATNALIERKGAKTGLLTTRGFGDTIFIQRLKGFTSGVPADQLGWYSRRRQPVPIVERVHVWEIPERIDQAGRILTPLNEAAVRTAIRAILHLGLEAVAVSLLWSFRNPIHEHRIRELVVEEAGESLFLTLSSDVSPTIGEYERTATAVMSSYLGPVVQRYLEKLEAELRARGFSGTFAVLNSVGGVVAAREAAQHAASLLTSGPTGGVIGSRYLADALGHDHVITADMGGTSFDVGLLINRRPVISAVTEVSQYHLALPIIDITAVGAGGGSIASVQDGLITVGPESAGAVPGPVCYGRGGTRPTVTDADLILGYLDPEQFLGGRMKLDFDAAAKAIDEHIGQPLNLGVEAAAAGIRRIVDSQMADTLRELTIGQGHDPRDFTLYAYGGAGPLHCAGFGAELGVKQIVIPATSMVHSAYGALASDVQLSSQRSVLLRSSDWDDASIARLEESFAELERRAREDLAANQAAGETRITRSLDMRFRRQAHELIVPAPRPPLTLSAMGPLVDTFERMYEDTYGPGSAFREAGIEITTLRVDAVGETSKPRLARHEPTGSPVQTRRSIYDTEQQQFVDAAILSWEAMTAGQSLDGPAVLRHPTTTVYVGASQRAHVDSYGNLLIASAGGV